MPGDLGEVAAGMINGVVYVVGEASKGNDPGHTYAYDVATGTWGPPLASRPYIGDHHGAEVLAGRLYLFGGLDAQGT